MRDLAMLRFAPLALSLGVLGCSQQPAEPPAVAQVPANVSLSAGPTDPARPLANPVAGTPVSLSPGQAPTMAQPTPPEPTAFEYPPDLGGKAVAKAVAPDKHALTPTERFGTSPKPRKLPAKFLDP